MKASRPQSITCDQQAKFVQDRISSVEKHLAELCTAFGAYARKAARLRDKNDEVAKVVHSYAEAEPINKSLKNGLANFSTTLSGVGDYRDAHVQRLESKVISELSQYESICKHAKEEVKNTFAARDRELARKRQLDRIRERNPRNRQQISMAESELMKASADVSRTVKALEEQIDMFEKRKLHDIRAILLNYATVEIGFHAKAVELFTRAYQDIADIDEDEDLKEFRNVLRVPDAISRLDTVKRTSFRNSSFSLAGLFGMSGALPQSTDTTSDNITSAQDSEDHVQDFLEYESSSMVSEEEREEVKHVRNKPKQFS